MLGGIKMYREITAEEYKKRFNLNPNYIVDGVLVFGSYNCAKQQAEFKKQLRKIYPKIKIRKLEYFLGNILEAKLDKKTIWFFVAYGGCMLSEYLHLACLFGSKHNILLGSCGVLQSGIGDNDMIMPKSAFGDESSTRMYDRRNTSKIHFSDRNLRQQLFDELAKNNIFGKIHTGQVITCQAMLAETSDDIRRWSKEGYIGVEMETSTFFAVSKHFHVPAVSFLHVCDNLINGEKVGDDSHQKKKNLRKELRAKLYQLALKKLFE